MFKNLSILSAAVLATSLSTAAVAVEYPLGQATIKNGLEVAAVYLQPITMDMEGMGADHQMHLPADKSDIHLEADIHATEGNVNGFPEGAWIPGLTVEYTIAKLDGGSKFSQSGTFMPMIASDGPHYGENLKLDGEGKYRATYKIIAPTADKLARHIDKETGVAPWFKPFEVTWDFEYKGFGRKGSY